jgi:hypothetical protein
MNYRQYYRRNYAFKNLFPGWRKKSPERILGSLRNTNQPFRGKINAFGGNAEMDLF